MMPQYSTGYASREVIIEYIDNKHEDEQLRPAKSK